MASQIEAKTPDNAETCTGQTSFISPPATPPTPHSISYRYTTENKWPCFEESKQADVSKVVQLISKHVLADSIDPKHIAIFSNLTSLLDSFLDCMACTFEDAVVWSPAPNEVKETVINRRCRYLPIKLSAHDHKCTSPLLIWKTLLSPQTSFAYLGRPHFPAGVIIEKVELINLLKTYPDTHFLIDETFIDLVYCDNTNIYSATDLVPIFNNLTVIRSLTHWFSTYGCPLYYMVSNQELISCLENLENLFTKHTLDTYTRIIPEFSWYKIDVMKRVDATTNLLWMLNNNKPAPSNISTVVSFANIMWLKSPISAEIMNMLAEHPGVYCLNKAVGGISRDSIILQVRKSADASLLYSVLSNIQSTPLRPGIQLFETCSCLKLILFQTVQVVLRMLSANKVHHWMDGETLANIVRQNKLPEWCVHASIGFIPNANDWSTIVENVVHNTPPLSMEASNSAYICKVKQWAALQPFVRLVPYYPNQATGKLTREANASFPDDAMTLKLSYASLFPISSVTMKNAVSRELVSVPVPDRYEQLLAEVLGLNWETCYTEPSIRIISQMPRSQLHMSPKHFVKFQTATTASTATDSSETSLM